MTDGPAGAEPESTADFKPPAKDPWAGLRGIMAGTLVLEVITVLLALPVIAKLDGLRWWSGAYIAVLTLLLVLGAGLQRRSWAIPYNLALQVAMVAGWFVHPAIGVLGLLFGAVWIYFLFIRKDIAYRESHGLLPGQRD